MPSPNTKTNHCTVSAEKKEKENLGQEISGKSCLTKVFRRSVKVIFELPGFYAVKQSKETWNA
jgi:hypothetical protein